jgi:hypothetical protein
MLLSTILYIHFLCQAALQAELLIVFTSWKFVCTNGFIKKQSFESYLIQGLVKPDGDNSLVTEIFNPP